MNKQLSRDEFLELKRLQHRFDSLLGKDFSTFEYRADDQSYWLVSREPAIDWYEEKILGPTIAHVEAYIDDIDDSIQRAIDAVIRESNE
jgi:hypothetical protein